MGISISPLKGQPFIRLNENLKRHHFNQYEPFFPFAFDEWSELYIGYSLMRLDRKFCENFLAEEYVKKSSQLELSSNFSIEHLGFIDWRLFEVYFEKPSYVVLNDYENIICPTLNPSTGQFHYIDESLRRFIVGDAALFNFINSSALILLEPSKSIKGVVFKDYKTSELKDYMHLLRK